MGSSYRLDRITTLVFGIVLAIGMMGCGGGGSTPSPTPTPIPTPTPTPAPTISSVSPSSVTAGGPAFVLTVNGSNFVSSSVVQFNGSPRSTVQVSATQVQGTITVADIAAGAQNTIIVANPAGQGGASGGFGLTVDNPVPAISSMNPTALAAGGAGFTMTVTGSNFVPTSVVQIKGVARPTTFVSSTTLQAAIPASDIASVGLLAVSVFNPAPAGGASGSLDFTAAFPPPRIKVLQPSSAVTGGGGFTMTIQGTNFVTSSVVKFNGSARTTTFVSSTELQAAITAADISLPGVANITVSNSVTNILAAAASNAGIDPTTSSASTFFTGTSGGAGFAQVVLNQGSRDLVYDGSQQLIYTSVPSTASTNANTISVLNLATVTIASSQPVGKDPDILAISDDGQFLYAGIDGANAIQRFSLPGPTKDISYSLGADPFFGPFFAEDLRVAPGAPHTVAVTLANSGVSPAEQGGVVVFDDATQRPTKFPGGANLVRSLQWGADATTLFGSDEFNGLDALSVSASGVTLNRAFGGVLNGDRIHRDAATGLVYSEGGEVVQSATGSQSATFNVRGPMAIDPALNGAFFMPQVFSAPAGTVQAFDLTRFTLDRSITLTGVSGNPLRLIRWGTNGLAFNTDGGQIVLVAGNFLDPISAPTPLPVPTPTPAPTPNPNPLAPNISLLNPGSAQAGGSAFTLTVNGANFTNSSVVQFNGAPRVTSFVSGTQLQAAIVAGDIATVGVSTVTVVDPANGPSTGSTFFTGATTGAGFAVATVNEPAEDIVFDPARKAIYLSVPNTVPEGNSIAVLDLATARIIGTQFAGSNPHVLSISDDSQFLYAGMDGSASVQRFALPALGMDVSYPLGTDSFFGPFFALDLQAAAGASHTSAVSRGIRGSSPSALGGIMIFDDATQRPVRAKGFGPDGGGVVIYDSLQWGADATALFAANLEDSGADFYHLTVNPTGVSLTQDSPSIGSGRIHFDKGTGLMYGESGRAVDPLAGLSAGIFAASGLMVPDSGLNTAFFLNQAFGSSTVTIESFDLRHFTSVGSITIPNINGGVQHLIRWGQNGLAFSTDAGQVVLVGGSFLAPIPPTFPTPAPLPPPAPTPAANAPVITLLSPSSAVAGSPGFVMTVTGTGFDPAATVEFNGSPLTTAFVSSTNLQATVPLTDFANQGAAIVTVVNPASAGGASAGSTFFVGASGGSNFAVSAINQRTNDLIFDPLHQVILFSVPGAAPAHGNTISALDPISENVISSQFAGSEPGVLALSDDSQFLYAGINGGAKVQRFTLPALSVDVSYSLGSGGFGNGSNIATDLQVAPGAPHTSAVTTIAGTVTVFDDNTARATSAPGGRSIQWGPTAASLFSTGDSFGNLFAFSAAAGGLTRTNDFAVDVADRLHFDRGNRLLWSENGHVVDPIAGSPVAVLGLSGPTVPDSTLNSAYVLTQGPSGVTLTSFDMTHFTPTGSITIPNVVGNAKRLIRWGQNGLAFNTDNGQIFLVAGNFVSPVSTTTPPATPLPAPAPTPAANAPVIKLLSPSFAIAGGAAFTMTVNGSGFDPAATVQFNGGALATTFVSSTQLTAAMPAANIATPGTAIITVANPVANGGTSAGSTFFTGAKRGFAGTGFAVTDLSLSANDLVFDPLHNVILLSVPSSASAGQTGNTISAIDLSGNVISSQFAGSQPNVLALSGDSQFLYSGIDGASKVQRFALPSLAPDINYSLGPAGFNGLTTALDLQVAPGSPHTTAVVNSQINPSNKITVFDDATARTNTVANGNSIQWGNGASALFSSTAFGSDLLGLTVDANGVALTNDFPQALEGRRIHFDPVTSRIYSDGGVVIDPATGLPTATFSAFAQNGLMVVDPALNAAYFVERETINTNFILIESFDLTRFVHTGFLSLNVPVSEGKPVRLIRWGQNGLAFNTDAGHVFLIGGDFVSPISTTLPPAAPLPTPVSVVPTSSFFPTIAMLSPSSVASGSTTDITLTVNGTNFAVTDVVQFNGAPLATTVVSSVRITAIIPKASVATSGTALVTVTGSGTSNTAMFFVGDTAGSSGDFAFTTVNQNNLNDLIYDPVHQVFLFSVSSFGGKLGNTVSALDLSGNVISSQFAGSDPNILGLSSDGQFLYAGIDGAQRAQRFSLPSFTPDISYSLGTPNAFSPPRALDVQVEPGLPHTVAYATGSLFGNTDGVVVFDDVAPRPARAFNPSSSIQWSNELPNLLGTTTSGTDLLTMVVDGSGVTGKQDFPSVFTSSNFAAANPITFVPTTRLVYSNGGRVVDPATGTLVGTFDLGPIPPGGTALMVVDPTLVVNPSTLGKAFFLIEDPTTSTATIRSFDLHSFTPIGSITIPNQLATPFHFVRWGTNGLAFSTNFGIVLVAGNFVN